MASSSASSYDRASCGRLPKATGVGLRFAHHRTVIETRPQVAWFEVHAENFFGGGAAIECLETIRHDYPVSIHGVGLSLGSAQGLDERHLDRVARLAQRIQPAQISEHLSWSIVDGQYLADLLPLPLTEEALDVVGRNVAAAQSALGRAILVENPSSYLRYRHSTIPEWEFLAAVAGRTGCGILCDVNNIFVSACNHGWDPTAYIAALPPAAIGEIHLAGHSIVARGGAVLRIDDHGSPVAAEVWRLYGTALARFGPAPTLIEWDTNLPDFAILLEEAAHADIILDNARPPVTHAIAA